MKWKLDLNAAMSAGQGEPIMEDGVYVGKLIGCVAKKAKTGSKGYEFDFEANDGRRARFLSLYTHKADGTIISVGFNKLHALLYLLKLRETEDVQVGEDHNGQPVYGLPQVCGKPIGVKLMGKEYETRDGNPGLQMEIAHWLDAETLKTSTEKHKNLEAKTAARPIPESKPKPTAATPSSVSNVPTVDDLPF